MKSEVFTSMNIQMKTWLIMCVVLPVCIIVNLMVLRNVLLAEFTEIEQAQIQQNIKRVENAISWKLELLHNRNSDLASWDDTYEFILTHDPGYIESNLAEDQLVFMGLNFLYFINEQGDIVWGQSIDLQTKEEILIDEFSAGSFTADNPLTGKATPPTGTNGIFHTSAGPALVSTAPILDSNSEGPRRGWIIMGILINENAIEELGKLTQLTLSIPFRLPSERLAGSLKALSDSSFYEIMDAEVIHGYCLLGGIEEASGVVLQARMSREIYRSGLLAIRYTAVLISITMVSVFLILSLLLQKFVVSPITRLTRHILELEKARDLRLRLPQKDVRCKDEAFILAAQVNRLLDTIEQMNNKLRDDARIDSLTMIANRRSYEEHLAMEWQRLMRTGGLLSVIMLDIDHFKLYNDRYGHQKGDDCLITVADVLRGIPRRPYDLAARYGGEEFVIVLPEADLDYAVNVAERIRTTVLDQRIAHEASPDGEWLTVSLGVGSTSVVMGTEPEELVKMADKALYMAKERGRNRVETLLGE